MFLLNIYDYLHNLLFNYTYIIKLIVSIVKSYYISKVNNYNLIAFLYVFTFDTLSNSLLYYFFESFIFYLFYSIIIYILPYIILYFYSKLSLKELCLIQIKIDIFFQTCLKNCLLKVNIIHRVKNVQFKNE